MSSVENTMTVVEETVPVVAYPELPASPPPAYPELPASEVVDGTVNNAAPTSTSTPAAEATTPAPAEPSKMDRIKSSIKDNTKKVRESALVRTLTNEGKACAKSAGEVFDHVKNKVLGKKEEEKKEEEENNTEAAAVSSSTTPTPVSAVTEEASAVTTPSVPKEEFEDVKEAFAPAPAPQYVYVYPVEDPRDTESTDQRIQRNLKNLGDDINRGIEFAGRGFRGLCDGLLGKRRPVPEYEAREEYVVTGVVVQPQPVLVQQGGVVGEQTVVEQVETVGEQVPVVGGQ